MNRAVLDGMLGFTGGVMVAASFWSLLAPAIENSPGEGFMKVVPAAIGFGLGALSLFGMDKILPHLHINFKESEAEGVKTEWHKTTLLVLAITLHNIPEGLAVGVLFGAASTLVGVEQTEMIIAAISLAIGIGIQNFPEGFAVAMPLRRQGVSRLKSFWYGQLSAVVEPVAAVLGALAVSFFVPIFAICIGICCRCNDFCSCRRSNTRNTKRQVYRYCYAWFYWWFYCNDVFRCWFRLASNSLK